MKWKYKGAGSVLPYREQKVLLRSNGEIEQIPIKPRRYDLFTREDMIEFAEYCIIE